MPKNSKGTAFNMKIPAVYTRCILACVALSYLFGAPLARASGCDDESFFGPKAARVVAAWREINSTGIRDFGLLQIRTALVKDVLTNLGHFTSSFGTDANNRPFQNYNDSIKAEILRLLALEHIAYLDYINVVKHGTNAALLREQIRGRFDIGYIPDSAQQIYYSSDFARSVLMWPVYDDPGIGTFNQVRPSLIYLGQVVHESTEADGAKYNPPGLWGHDERHSQRMYDADQKLFNGSKSYNEVISEREKLGYDYQRLLAAVKDPQIRETIELLWFMMHHEFEPPSFERQAIRDFMIRTRENLERSTYMDSRYLFFDHFRRRRLSTPTPAMVKEAFDIVLRFVSEEPH
jgi:hypothetical protein